MMEDQSRISGGLLGVAVGDALGATVEFLSPSEINDRFGVHREIVGGGAFNWKPGEGTDDTDLTWAVLPTSTGRTRSSGRQTTCWRGST